MRYSVGQRVVSNSFGGGIRPKEEVTIIEAFEKANVEIYKAKTDDGRWTYYTKDMLEEEHK